MFKILLNSILYVTMLLGGNMKQKTIQQYLSSTSQAQVIIDGEFNEVRDTQKLNNILSDMLKDSHEMPAFGVSVHTETLKVINNGVWLRLQYNGTQVVDEMNFDELLIQVEPNYTGFNIIRGNRGIYEGRCYYIDLIQKDMSMLYNYLSKI